ncbi:MAG: redoxin domain-containing protein [SAR324 cluster bacterium]|nr:redoxin domain-containing protein [SAR324 cluster bacterium]
MAEFEGSLEAFSQINTSVYAYSTDSVENAAAMISKHGLTLPVLCEVNGPEMVEKLGVYYEEKRNILHANSYVLKGNQIMSITISNGPIGRTTARDVLGYIKFLQK